MRCTCGRCRCSIATAGAFPWTLAANAGTNVCLRRVEAKPILDAIREHKVTHYCGAPIVHSMLINAPAVARGIDHKVSALVAAAPPPASMIEGMNKIGFDITHVYGLTETYGPAAVCAKHEWSELPLEEQVRLNGRQGVRYHLQEGVTVMDPETMQPVPRDGETMGEIMFRGNITMKGYLKNPKATEEAFRGGWYHSGDLAVMHPDGYVKIKDRSKDVIISGGENISSVEVEDVLYRHAAVLAAAVVATPDPKWGEVPCAFIELKEGAQATEAEFIAFCRERMARFKVPKKVVFGPLPKTSTGKIQKFVLREKAKSTQAIELRRRHMSAPAIPQRTAAAAQRRQRRDDPHAEPRQPVQFPVRRPDRRELQAALDAIAEDKSVRVVVLAGAGKAFCAGHDLKEMRANPDKAYQQKLFRQCGRMMMKLTEMPQPVIARVHGIATAAGCQLVAMCDLAVAAEGAKFAVSGINLGLFCSTPAVPLSRNLPRKQAIEMLVTGEFIDAPTALRARPGQPRRAADQARCRGEETHRFDPRQVAVAVGMGKQMFYRRSKWAWTAPTSWPPRPWPAT
jgi:hypothetical protein